MKIFYLNGDKNSNMFFKENGQLYDYLLSNYEIEFDNISEKILITKEILENIIENEIKLSKDENILISNLWYNIEYNGAYIFY